MAAMLVALLPGLTAMTARGVGMEPGGTRLHDGRLQLVLFAEDPQIVTPIGAAVDSRDRLFVVESHTHQRPRNYDGPATDQIKVFEDRDRDGRCDNTWVFADGLSAAMNLAFAPDGALYAVCARSVEALYDDDDDGVCDRRVTVLRLETTERYAHSCLLSLAFSPDGWLYIGRGNTGGRAWTLHGTDGTYVTGYGDGGNIMRCQPDGTHVELFATGFWNPFDIQVDHAGRLLCVDNDPDARGPNRLVHVVDGGDYGYRALFGGGGNHPYQGWNGDLPGSLPYVSGTGEAPSGLLDCRYARLPSDYSNSVLITVWNENSIERHQLRPWGTSLVGERSVLAVGGKEFRPVAIVPDSQGAIYVTDWVLVDYPNHGRGRIWRLSTRRGADATGPLKVGRTEPADAKRERIANHSELARVAMEATLASDDPFQRHAGVMTLAGPAGDSIRASLVEHENARVRLGCLLSMKRCGTPDQEALSRWLGDDDPRVRRAALIWVGEAGLTRLRTAIDRTLTPPAATDEVVATYLSTVPLLSEKFIADLRDRQAERASSLVPETERALLQRVAQNGSLPTDVRAFALRRLPVSPGDAAWLSELVSSDATGTALRQAAVDSLERMDHDQIGALLRRLAGDTTERAWLRGDAIAALAKHRDTQPAKLLGLLNDDDAHVRVAAARALRSLALSDVDRDQLHTRLDDRLLASPAEVREALALAIGQDSARPASDAEWEATLESGGDPVAGRRVFYAAASTCAKCHVTDGMGGALGPSLANLAQSLDRQQIIQAILRPSDQFPPQYQAWNIITIDGRVHTGLQLDHKAGGDIELLTTDGVVRHFHADQIEDYLASKVSIMPDDLESSLTVSELRDLVAYLATLR